MRGSYNESDSEYQGEVLLTFCGQAEKVIELLHGSCDAHNLPALIPAVSRLELSCRRLGAENMALTLGQVRFAAEEKNSRAVRWLLTSLSQEYATVSSTIPEYPPGLSAEHLVT